MATPTSPEVFEIFNDALKKAGKELIDLIPKIYDQQKWKIYKMTCYNTRERMDQLQRCGCR